MLMAAMKKNQRLAGGPVGGPIAIKQARPVAGSARPLFRYAHFDPASPSPPRTRFTTVTVNSNTISLGSA